MVDFNFIPDSRTQRAGEPEQPQTLPPRHTPHTCTQQKQITHTTTHNAQQKQ
jgi:hypothetical protein